MDKTEQDMARVCFGYGSWAAPFWFIGLEQGKGRNEPADNTLRVNAWEQLGAEELCDCEAFHRLIGEKRYHDDAKLQSTWRPLMILLMSYLGRPADTEAIRAYQRSQWGRLEGETCLIELSGLAAKSIAMTTDRDSFRTSRMDTIAERLSIYKPELVVMYGGGLIGKATWERVAASALKQHDATKLESRSSVAVLARHPVAPGAGNAYWADLGAKASKLAKQKNLS